MARYILYKRMAIVRKSCQWGCRQQRQRPERDLETTPVFSGLTKMFGCAPSDKARRECLRWIREVWFENARGLKIRFKNVRNKLLDRKKYHDIIN